MQERIETRKVEEALRRLEVHHDALRLRYARNAKGWTQQLLEEGVRNFELEEVSLEGVSGKDLDARVTQACSSAQGRLDISPTSATQP